MPPPIGLVNLSIGDLIGAAGGDPWKMNDELQTGDPGAINAQADAFHAAAGSATEVEDDFKSAKQRFEKGWRHNGSENPINESAEVTRITDTLHLQKPQLGKIALDLERVAGSLATAQSTCDAEIASLDRFLHGIDDAIGAAKTHNQDVKALHDAAVNAVGAALGTVRSSREKYVAAVVAAKPSLDSVTAPPLIGPGINGPVLPGKSDPNGPLIGPGANAGVAVNDQHPDTTKPPEWLGDAIIGSAGGVSGVTADGVRQAVLGAIKEGPTTGPGAADPGLLKWLEEPKIGGFELRGFSRIGGLAALVGAMPAIASDMHGSDGKPGNSAAEAITREATGAAVGLYAGSAVGGVVAGSEMGAAIGSVVPGAGTAIGLVVGAAVGGVVSYGTSKGIEAIWSPISNAVGSATHSVESVFGFG